MLSEDEIVDAESNGHSLFGGSKWHRIIPCPHSLLAEIGKPDTAGVEAAEGTVAHSIAAFWLEWGLEKKDFVDEVGKVHKIELQTGTYEITVDWKMLNQLERYVDWCRELPGEHFVEHLLDFSALTPIPRQGGSADHVALLPNELTITDLKYGTGVQVFAEDNEQASGYALGVILKWDWLYNFDKVTIRICQPRLEHFDVWETTKTHLLQFAEFAKQRFALAWKPDAPFGPTEKACKFCKARPGCPAAVSVIDRLADETFIDVRPLNISTREVTSALANMMEPEYLPPLPVIGDMTTEQITRFLEYRKMIEHHFEAAYQELNTRCLAKGEPIPPTWMKAKGKSSRSIRSKVKLFDIMQKQGISILDLFACELLSPAQLEAMLIETGLRKKEAVELLEPAVFTTPGKPTLSPRTKGKTEAVDLADLTFEDTRKTDL